MQANNRQISRQYIRLYHTGILLPGSQIADRGIKVARRLFQLTPDHGRWKKCCQDRDLICISYSCVEFLPLLIV